MKCDLNWLIPDDDAELRLRLRPLREHWEARGPGMLGRVGDLLPWLEIPPQISIRLITPRIGGAGRVTTPSEIEFEAVLANPWPLLPEVVRLAWLITTIGVASNSKANPLAATLDWRTQVCFFPAIIEAAEFVDLARCDEATIDCALTNWGNFSQQAAASDLLAAWRSLDLPADQQAWQEAFRQI